MAKAQNPSLSETSPETRTCGPPERVAPGKLIVVLEGIETLKAEGIQVGRLRPGKLIVVLEGIETLEIPVDAEVRGIPGKLIVVLEGIETLSSVS